MTSATTYSRLVLRGAVIAAEFSSRLLDKARELFAHVSCTPSNEAVDVRALAYSLPHENSAEREGLVDRPIALRHLPPL